MDSSAMSSGLVFVTCPQFIYVSRIYNQLSFRIILQKRKSMDSLKKRLIIREDFNINSFSFVEIL